MKNNKLKVGGRIVYIPVKYLRSFPLRPRVCFRAEDDASLADSIAQLGLLEPLTVCYAEEDAYYVVSGERRFRAAVSLGFREVPCVLIPGDVMDCALCSLAENVQQARLHCFETAACIEKICEAFSLSYAELSLRTGIPQREIRAQARYLSIPVQLRQNMIEHNLSEPFAKLLLHHADDNEKKQLLDGIIAEKLTLAEAKTRSEEILKGRRGKKPRLRTFFRDLNVFLNTIEHAVDAMNESGIRATSEKTETDTCVEYRIRIPKA
ncbi:MAG: ParB/RepB/Spo0J family partition protein [Clostridia bacterium]|nr:ParB/RepB/Spo0J family partition protein [Clostridia bacterium]